MSSRALAAYFGALVSLASPVPLAGDPAPPLTSAGHSLRKGDRAVEAAGGRATAGPSEAPGPLETTATLVNVHSGEAIALDARGPSDERFARLMPDRTNGEVRGFDPRLLTTLRRVAERHPGARVELVSGYRSPKFNEQLRKKGHRVASHSEHSRGHALDVRVEGLSPAELVADLRAVGWKGGLGRYDRPGDRFVHFDVGRERFWMGR